MTNSESSFVKELYNQLGMEMPAQAKSRDLLKHIFEEEEDVESIMMDATYVFKEFIEFSRRQYETYLSSVEGGDVYVEDVLVELIKLEDEDEISYSIKVENPVNTLSAFLVSTNKDLIFFKNTSFSPDEDVLVVKNTSDLKELLKESFEAMGLIIKHKGWL